MSDKLNNSLFSFIKRSPTAYHAVDSIKDMLGNEGYEELREEDEYCISPGGRYYVIRNGSSLIAFRVPEGEISAFRIAASHSDSPLFKLKKDPEMASEGAYVRLNTERYGGMLMHPWYDRPLSVAGRIVVRGRNGKMAVRLVNVDRDLLIIPSLAIHMDRDANKGHELNPQKELLPLFGDEEAKGSLYDIIAEAAGVKAKDIVADDLFVYPRSEGTRLGAAGEYIASPRLDDLQCTFADLTAFIESARAGRPARDDAHDTVPVLAVFDNEEVGSLTMQGADSTFLEDTLTRLFEALQKSAGDYKRAIALSFMVSADNAHAVHPAYGDKADPVNRPVLNKGIVIKHNAAQKYTTDAVSAAVFRDICKRAGVPVQDYANCSDVAGGSTLGNLSNAHVSLHTVDIGLPQLAMHSPFETAGAYDTAYLVKAMTYFYRKKITIPR